MEYQNILGLYTFLLGLLDHGWERLMFVRAIQMINYYTLKTWYKGVVISPFGSLTSNYT